jgi:dTDP-glucose 4,6-dehydratase
MSGDVVIVTGGAGFIGSALVRYLIRATDARVVNVDRLTYAADLANVAEVEDNERYAFARCDVCRPAEVEQVFKRYRPTAVMHLAAETHVDRSIDDPLTFVDTNIRGTATLLEASRHYWQKLPRDSRTRFRFHHISTDEVFGSLGRTGAFDEESPYRPNSPYAASKAAADHLVRAWHITYGLPVVISNCSNNYGPYQHPEKFIPRMILCALFNEPLPVYGDGSNVREWLYVDDHADALWTILRSGRNGESYNVGGYAEARNIDVAHVICDLVDELAGPSAEGPRRSLITFVEDRPGHDFRYAMNAAKLAIELGWQPRTAFDEGLRRTVAWYVKNRPWWEAERATNIRRGRVFENVD